MDVLNKVHDHEAFGTKDRNLGFQENQVVSITKREVFIVSKPFCLVSLQI